jgi:ligand-binding sensor domain-containing protein
MTAPPWRPLGASVVERGQLLSDASSGAMTSGRVTAIALDPGAPSTHLYAGTGNGGVWRTDDGGQTWTPIGDDLPSLSIGALAIAPSKADWLYIGTGEANPAVSVPAGVGVIRYDRAAGTTTPILKPALEGQSISRIIVDATDPEHLFVAATNGVFERTFSGGTQTWTQLLTGTIDDLLYDSSGPGYLWAGAHGFGIYLRQGTGAFTKLADPRGPGSQPAFRRVALAQCESARGTVYAIFTASDGHGVAGIFRADDAPTGATPGSGPTWKVVAQPTITTAQTSYNLFLAVHPQDKSTVFFGEARVHRSVNGGAGWKVISDKSSGGLHADQHAIAMEPPSDAVLAHLKLWVGNDGGVWRSEDGGDTWSPRNRGLQTLQYLTLSHHPDAPGIMIAGAQDNGTQRRLGTAAFELVDYGDGAYTAIDPAVPSLFYDAKSFNAVQRSTKAGRRDSFETADAKGIGMNDDALFYAPFVLEPGSPKGTPSPIWVGTDRLYRSTDRGDSFQVVTTRLVTAPTTAPLATQGVSAIAIAPNNPGRLYAGTSDGRLWRIDRPGASWPSTPFAPQDITAKLRAAYDGGVDTKVFISAIAVHPTVPDTLYVAAGANHLVGWQQWAGATKRVFVSTDGGGTFNPIAIPPELTFPSGLKVPVARNAATSIAIDPAHPDKVYVGCDVGVFQYDAAANTVSEWRNGLPNAPVMELIVHESARLVRAATLGRGLWEADLDKDAAAVAQVELHLRDTYLELQPAPTPATRLDPLGGLPVSGTVSPDVLIDTPSLFGSSLHLPSTVDYTATGALDYVGYDLLDGGSDPRRSKTSKVYVRIGNRGPGVATGVKTRVFWAGKGLTDYPPLPGDFWTAFPDSDPADTTMWKPIGPAQTISPLGPREPMLASWDWPVPSDAPSALRLLAAVTSTEDPIAGVSGTDSAAAALASRFVAVRDVDVSIALQEIELILLMVGVIVLAGVGFAALQ